MGLLLRLASAIDAVQDRVGRTLAWLSLVMVLLAAVNAVLRYVGAAVHENLTSNAMLEGQWYLFAIQFLVGAAWALRREAHVRVDVVYSRLSAGGKAAVDVAGTLALLVPFVAIAIWVTWPGVRSSWAVWEASVDPGGLPRWPIRAVPLLGWYLLLAQAASQLIKAVAALRAAPPSQDIGMGLAVALVPAGVIVAGHLGWIPDAWLGGALFLTVLGMIFLGYPVAFVLGGVAVVFGQVGYDRWLFDWTLFYALPERVFGVMGNAVLLAVPFFIFMGTVLERTRLAEDLLTTIGALFGARPGGLALAVVGVGTLLAAATGVVGATVVAMGTITLPVMLRYGYDRSFATGVIAASGTLGQIIPPSVVLVVLGDQLGVSVGDLFVAAMAPGLFLAATYAGYVVVRSAQRPDLAPPLPPEARPMSGAALASQVARVMVPPLALILIVLGSIFTGAATPTEAGALGAVGAMALAWTRGRLDLAAVRDAAATSAALSTMAMFLLIGSTAFTLVFRGVYGDLWVESFFRDLPGGALALVVITQLAFFILGFFIDFFEIAFILLPLLVPAARVLGVDLVWLGVTLGINLQTSFLTPPFGFALFYLRGVAPPQVSTADIYRGVAPFIVLQLLVLLVVLLEPGWFGL